MITASVNLSDGPLKALAEQIDDVEGAFVKVGILGAYARRGVGEVAVKRWLGKNRELASWSGAQGRYLTNADIGVIHEFGAPKARMPERSFLRMPVLSRLDDELKKTSAKNWMSLLVHGGLVGLLGLIGQSAVNVIHDAFNTGGFGRWQKLNPKTVARKGSAEILVETTQLRRSISFAVVAGGASHKDLK